MIEGAGRQTQEGLGKRGSDEGGCGSRRAGSSSEEGEGGSLSDRRSALLPYYLSPRTFVILLCLRLLLFTPCGAPFSRGAEVD